MDPAASFYIVVYLFSALAVCVFDEQFYWLSITVKCLVVQSAASSSAVDLEENYFDFRKQCFVHSKEKGTFCKLSYPTKETFGYYLKCSGHGSEAKVLAATEKWGRNVWVSFFSDHFYYSSDHNLPWYIIDMCIGFVFLYINIYELDMS